MKGEGGEAYAGGYKLDPNKFIQSRQALSNGLHALLGCVERPRNLRNFLVLAIGQVHARLQPRLLLLHRLQLRNTGLSSLNSITVSFTPVMLISMSIMIVLLLILIVIIRTR